MKLNIVPARTGVLWVKGGIAVFWRQPMAMAALFFMTMAAMSLVSLVPFIGPALALVLLPSATLAMMVASGEAIQGRFPTPAVLLTAFRTGRQHLQHMLVLGALYAVGFMAVMGISALFDGGQFAEVYLGGAPMTREVAENGSFQLAMWVAMVLYLPLSLLFWHAPGLVHWHGVPPVKSLFFSFVACVRNFGAFAVYGLAWFGVFALGGVIISLVSALLAVLGVFSAESAPSAIGGLMMGLAMVMAAMFFSSIVFTFRDCFQPPEVAPAPTEGVIVDTLV
ncbi:BPSS1780 family membrane protein [Simplicispira psychrophila]|uniref:BPSS1780 family membrane protein n=1 Tax=Simplicispira psychrophila TaxID=80882 RepID=UPI000482D1A5|nr:BPSS1780 family membrane protein [Simplicispira psychrophila]